MTSVPLLILVPPRYPEMLRITVKFPCSGLPLVQRHVPCRLYNSKRYCQSKCPEPTKKLKSQHGIGGGATGFYYTVGTLTLVTGASVACSKYNPDFRRWLATQAPWTDHVLSALFQEEKTWKEQFIETKKMLKSRTWKLLFGGEAVVKYEKREEVPKKIDDPCLDIREKKEYKAPRSVFSSLLLQPPETPEKTWAEIRVMPEPTQEFPNPPTEVVSVTGDKDALNVLEENDLSKLPETHPKNLVDLEQKIADSASLAIAAYQDAICAVREHIKEVCQLVDDSIDEIDAKQWASLKVKTEKKMKAIRDMEEKANLALANVHKLKGIVEDTGFDASDTIKTSAKRNITRVLTELESAEDQFNLAKKKASITEKYWNKVEEARRHYTDELEILFPTIKIGEKEWNLSSSDLDLFIYHCYQNVLFYQKELHKLEMLGEDRIKNALQDASESDSNESLIHEAIERELEKERRTLAIEFQKKILNLKTEGEKEMRLQLKRQAEAHSDHLVDAVAVREKELEREFLRAQDEKIAIEHAKFKYQLGGMMGRLKGLETSLKARANADKSAHQAQLLWSACQALHSSISYSVPDTPWHEQLRPLEPEINSIKKAALGEDSVVDSIVEGIPPEALNRGVYSENALRERFLNVEKTARRIALVPENGASLPIFLLSYLQSMLLIRAVNPISQAELADEPVEFAHLDTYDILLRSRYWVDRGNFEQALRYLNLLRGAPRSAAYEWMNEARILLETQQAANALMVHAGATGLLFI